MGSIALGEDEDGREEACATTYKHREGYRMKGKKRADRSMAIVLALALAFTMNVPAAAWGDHSNNEDSLGSFVTSGQDGVSEADGSSVAGSEDEGESSGQPSTDKPTDGSDVNASRNADHDDGISGDGGQRFSIAGAGALANRNAVDSIGPLRIFYALDEGIEQEIGSGLNGEEQCVLDELGLDPAAFGVLHLRISAAEGYSLSADADVRITNVSVSWQAVTADGMTLSYGIDLREEGDALVCDIPSSLVQNVSNGEYERFAVSWTTDGAPPEIHGSAFGSYLGFNLFKAAGTANFETASLMGVYRAENGTAIVLATSDAGRTIAISDEVASDGSPAVSAFKDVAIVCDHAGNPYRTEVDANYSANAKFAVGEDGAGNRTLTSLGTCTYRTAQGPNMGSISEGQVFTRTMVASVHGAAYSTLQEAVDAAQAGETVVLLEDVQENVVVPAGKDVALDLNGRTVAGRASSDDSYINDTITVEGKLAVRDTTAPAASVVSDDRRTVSYVAGKILGKEPTVSPYAKALHIQNGGSATIESGIVESQDSDAVFVGKGSILAVEGGYIHGAEFGIGVQGTGATLKMNGGVVVADDNAAIRGNGTEGDDYGDTSISISGGTVIGRIEADGYIACGIYHPQRGKLSIAGGTVYADGGVGILMRGGTLEMTDGAVIASGTASGKVGDSAIVQNCYGVHIDGASGYYDGANSKATVSGGLVEADAGVPVLNLAAPGTMTVRGGTFSSDVTAYLETGRIVTENADGMYVVENDQVATVTKPNGTSVMYDTLSTAVIKARNGDVVTLHKDVPAGNVKYEIGYSIVLDLNGHSIDGSKYATVSVNKYQGPINVIVKNGTILNSTDGTGEFPFGTAIQVRQDVDLTLENVVVDTSSVASGVPSYGVRVGLGTNDSRNPRVTIKGVSTHIKGPDAGIAVIGSNASAPSSLTVEDGVIEGNSFGIVGNGDCDGTSIAIKGGIVRSTDADGCAVYHPQNGDLTISEGTLTGANGVQFCGEGKLAIEGGSIEATASTIETPDTTKTGSSIPDGAALSLVSRGGGYGASGTVEVGISGGTLTSKNNAAIQEYAAADADSLVKSLSIGQAEGATLRVSGGVGKLAVSLAALSGDAAKAITGGTFSSDPLAYLAEGFVAVEGGDGMFEVAENQAVEVIDADGISKGSYNTLTRAVAQAESGDKVKLLADIEDAQQINVRKDITLDLGGKTYRNSNDSMPFSVVNSSLTVENGTIEAANSDSIAIYVQNAKLVLNNGAAVKAAGYGVQVGNMYQTTGYRGDAIINEGASVEAAHGPGIYVVGYYPAGEAEDGSLSDAQTMRNTLTLNGGTVVSLEGNKYAAISGNGNKHGTRIVINSGTVRADKNNAAIYHPQLGSLVINGGDIEGGTGIEMRAGTLDLSGDAVVAGVLKPTTVNPNGSGGTTEGAGIAVAQHTTKLPIAVNVSGGTISGFSAIYESNPQDNSVDDLAKVSLSVAAGTFKAINDGKLAVYSQDKEDFVTGGTFNTVLDTAYYDEGIYQQNVQDAVDAPGAVVPRVFAIDYILAGGAFAGGVQAPASYTAFSDDIALPQPTRTGYDFAGWTGTGLTAPTVDAAIAKGSSGNRSYTAVWTPRSDASYTVHYYLKGSSSAKIAEDAVVSGRIFGETYSERAPKIDGYVVNGLDSQTVTIDAYDKELAFFYDTVAAVPDANVIVQVEQPAADEFAAPDQTVAAAATAGAAAVQEIASGETPAGMSPEEAQAVRDLIDGANGADVTVVVSLKAELKEESVVDPDEKGAIEDVSDDGETVALYFELSVEMTVKVDGGSEKTVLIDEVDEPLLFELKVKPDDIAGKSARIAHVHDGATEIIVPESVDYEQGIVRFHASAFSTYALLAADTVTVGFESNGGSAVASQTVAFGGRATKPADPTRAGYTFGGWFSDEGLTSVYDFNTSVERPTTLYAKWTAAGSGKPDDSGTTGDPGKPDDTSQPPAHVDSGGDQDSAKRPPASAAPNTLGGSASTGDPLVLFGTAAAVLAAAATLALAAVMVHRRRRDQR